MVADARGAVLGIVVGGVTDVRGGRVNGFGGREGSVVHGSPSSASEARMPVSWWPAKAAPVIKALHRVECWKESGFSLLEAQE
jgi:hypothetical protein